MFFCQWCFCIPPLTPFVTSALDSIAYYSILLNGMFAELFYLQMKYLKLTVYLVFMSVLMRSKHRCDKFLSTGIAFSQKQKLLAMVRVGYRSHLNRYQYRYRYLEFGTGTQRYLFSVLYSLCNNKNIYFSEKISLKLSISTFWTIGPYNFFIFFIPEMFVLFFSNNQMKAWNIYLFLIKWKWNTFIFWQTNRGLLLKSRLL